MLHETIGSEIWLYESTLKLNLKMEWYLEIGQETEGTHVNYV